MSGAKEAAEKIVAAAKSYGAGKLSGAGYSTAMQGHLSDMAVVSMALAYLDLERENAKLREALPNIFALMDDADEHLDVDIYDQLRRDEFNPPADAEYSICAGTAIKCSKVFGAIDKLRTDLDTPAPTPEPTR